MMNDLIQEDNFDHRLSFDNLPSISSLADETFEKAEAAGTNDVYQKNGRINTHFLIKNARILLKANDIDLAKKIFQTLIENNESLGLAYAGLAVCYVHRQELDKAIKSYRESIIYEPSYSSLLALSDLYIRQSNHKEAIKTLLRANHLPKISKKETFEIHKKLGNCYLWQKQLEHAENHYSKAYEIIPESEILHTNIGCLAIQKKDTQTALLHFKEAIRLNNENTNAQTGIGLCYFDQNEIELAYNSFTSALDISISNQTALFYLIKCAYICKKYSKTIEILNSYIEKNKININILYGLAGLLFHNKEFNTALEICNKILKLKPEHSGVIKLKELIEQKGH